MARYFFVLAQSRSRCCGSVCMISSAAWRAAAWLGLIAALKIVCLEWVRRYSITSRERGDEAAGAGERLGKAAADHVDLVVEPEVVDRAAALAAEDAEAMGVVEHREAAVLLGDLGELRQAGDVALHRVDALDDEHLRRRRDRWRSATSRRSSGLLWEKRSTVAMERRMPSQRQEWMFLSARMTSPFWAKVATVDRHGKVAGGVDVAGLAAEEGGELFLQLDVEGARAVGRARAGGAGAPFARGGAGGLDDLGMEGQPEVIVARKHDHVASVQADGRALLRLHRVVVRRVFQPHLGRVVVVARSTMAFLFLVKRESAMQW